MDPELEELLRLQKQGEDDDESIVDVVKFRTKAEQGMRKSKLSCNMFSGSVEDIQIPVRDSHMNTGRIYRPPGSTRDEPVIVWYHGGGFCLGDVCYDDDHCYRLCVELHAVIVSLNYRLAPEHPFPIPIHDCWDGLQWVASNRDRLQLNIGAGFILSGSSAGGNIAAVLSLLARESKDIPLTGVYLGLPIVVHPDAVPERFVKGYLSYEENKNAPILCQKEIAALVSAYMPDPLSPLYSPLLWPSGHAGLPPTYFQVCGLDPLRDDGLIYERMLREEYNIRTKLDIYPGVPHAFQSFTDLKVTKEFNRDMVSGFKWLLGIE